VSLAINPTTGLDVASDEEVFQLIDRMTTEASS